MLSKKRKKEGLLNLDKPERPSPRTLEGLRWERKKLREIVETLQGGQLPMKNDYHLARRKVVSDLLEICNFPKRHDVNSLVLRSALEVLSYQDQVAISLLQTVADVDYLRYIKAAKKAAKMKEV